MRRRNLWNTPMLLIMQLLPLIQKLNPWKRRRLLTIVALVFTFGLTSCAEDFGVNDVTATQEEIDSREDPSGEPAEGPVDAAEDALDPEHDGLVTDPDDDGIVDSDNDPADDSLAPRKEGVNGTKVTGDESTRAVLDEYGYVAEDGWTTDITDAAFDDIADNHAGLMIVADSNPVTAEEAAAAYKDDPTIGGSYEQKANPDNWVLVYSPECFVYDDMVFKRPDSTYGRGGGFVECGVAEWLNIPALRDDVDNARARLRCGNANYATARRTDEEPSFPQVAPEPKIANAEPTPGKVEVIKAQPVHKTPVKVVKATQETVATVTVINKVMYPRPEAPELKECECFSIPIVIEDCPEEEQPKPSASPSPSATPSGAAPSPSPSASPSTSPEPSTPPTDAPEPEPSEEPTQEPEPVLVEVCLNQETGEVGPVPESEVGNYPSVEDCKPNEQTPPEEEEKLVEVCYDIATGEIKEVPESEAHKYPTSVEDCKVEEVEEPEPVLVEVCLNQETGEVGPVPESEVGNYPSVEDCKPEEGPKPGKDGDKDLVKDEGINPRPAPEQSEAEESLEDVPAPVVPFDPELEVVDAIPVGQTDEETVLAPGDTTNDSPHDDAPAGPVMSDDTINPDYGQVDREEQNASPDTATGAEPVVDPVTGGVVVEPGAPVVAPNETPSTGGVIEPDGTDWTGQPISVEPAPVQAPAEVASTPAAPVVDPAPAAPATAAPAPVPAPAPAEVEAAPQAAPVDMAGAEDVPPPADEASLAFVDAA